MPGMIYPWLIWLLSASFFFYKYVLQVSPSVMSAELMQAFTMTGAGLGNLAACFFYAYLLMQIPVGLLLDKYGPRFMMGISIFICSLGTLLFAHAHTVLIAGISRAMIGFGAAFAAVSCFKLATLWFAPNRFALVAGLSMTAAMLGAVGGEAPLSFLVTHYGWRQAMIYVAIPGFILMLLILLFVRNNPAKTAKNKAESINYRQLWLQIKIILSNKQTWLLSCYSGLAFAPVSVFGGLWGVAFLKQAYHLTPDNVASIVSLIFIGFAIGCPIAGWFSDYIKRRKIIMLAGTLIALISIIGVLYMPVTNSTLLALLMLSFGLGASCFFLCFSMVREIHPVLFAATVLGFMNTFDSICEAITEPFIGKLLDISWHGTLQQGSRLFSISDYHMALMVLPIYFIMALLLLIGIRETYCKQNSRVP